MDGYKRRSRQKKTQIRQAGFRLFGQKGYRKTTVGEIAAEAGVSPVTIYNLFGSKKELLKEVIGEYFESQWERFARITGSGQSYPSLIRQIFEEKTALEETSPQFLNLIPMDDPEILAIIETWYRTRTIPLILDIIRQGKREGVLEEDLPEDAVLLYLQTFRMAQANPALWQPEAHSLRTGMVRLFFYGLLGTPPRPLQQPAGPDKTDLTNE